MLLVCTEVGGQHRTGPQKSSSPGPSFGREDDLGPERLAVKSGRLGRAGVPDPGWHPCLFKARKERLRDLNSLKIE